MIRLLVLSLCLIAPGAFASDLEDAQQALSSGQYERAVKHLDKHLSRKPQDAQARFQKGLALVMLERDKEAINVFSDLARDFPELPEPYNNLAVLYARNGRYEEARDALEAALVSHPSYATAHENMGDIYAALAKASYNRAAVLDKSNTVLTQKLAVLAQLDPNSKAPAEPIVLPQATPVSLAAAPTSAPATPAPQSPASLPARPGYTGAAALATPAPTQAPQRVAQAAPQPAASTPAPQTGADILGNSPLLATTPTLSARPGSNLSKSNPEEARIMAAVNGWAKAWSEQDVDAYLGHYGPNFEPVTGISRADWESQRRSRIVRPSSISIQVLSPSVFVGTATFARVKFTQIYESTTYADQVRKELELEKVGNKWMIVSERVVN